MKKIDLTGIKLSRMSSRTGHIYDNLYWRASYVLGTDYYMAYINLSIIYFCQIVFRNRRGRKRMVGGFITT